jgi:hypothetical protein
MPNWCNNTLIVRGDKTEMESFLRSIEVKPCNVDDPMGYDFSILHPLPEDQKDDWYNWCNKNWGTKWSPAEVERDDAGNNPHELMFQFQTPWCPATNLFKFISKMYPHLVFYESGYESGVGFAVSSAIYRGEVIEELGFSYSEVDMISEYEKEISKAIENDEEMKEEEIRQDMEDAIDQLIHKDLLEVLEVIPTAVESKIPKKFLAEMQNN